MVTETYYVKRGRRYVPVAAYDSDYSSSFPIGSHLVIVSPTSTMRMFNVEPAVAPMVAAGQLAKNAMTTAIQKANKVQPPRRPMTPQEHQAWLHLIEVWGEQARCLPGVSPSDVADAGIQALQHSAEKLLQHPAVKKAYDDFLFVAKLANVEFGDLNG